MYHLGKVIYVMSPDEKGSKFSDQARQAMIEMWDDNVIIFRVNPAIARELKENDYVSVDYSPVAIGGAPVPKHEVVAIVSEPKAKKVWARLREKLEEKKGKKRTDSDTGLFHGKMVG